MNEVSDILFSLLRLSFWKAGEGNAVPVLPEDVPWKAVMDLSMGQGVGALAVDGLQKVYDAAAAGGVDPGTVKALDALDDESIQDEKYAWLGSQLNREMECERRNAVAGRLAQGWAKEGLEMWVLKGSAVAQYYPVPEHRYSCDLDCYVRDAAGTPSGKKPVFVRSNEAIGRAGIKVDCAENKHSHFTVAGVPVENHQFFVNVKGRPKDKEFARLLLEILEDGSSVSADGTKLPGWLFNAAFCVFHARTHFLLEEGITLKHVCDWIVLRRSADASGLEALEQICVRFGLVKFQRALDGVSDVIMGKIDAGDAPVGTKRLLENILSMKRHRTLRTRFAKHLNIFRMILAGSWKFRLYCDDATALGECWRYVVGYFFDRRPEL